MNLYSIRRNQSQLILQYFPGVVTHENGLQTTNVYGLEINGELLIVDDSIELMFELMEEVINAQR